MIMKQISIQIADETARQIALLANIGDTRHNGIIRPSSNEPSTPFTCWNTAPKSINGVSKKWAHLSLGKFKVCQVFKCQMFR